MVRSPRGVRQDGGTGKVTRRSTRFWRIAGECVVEWKAACDLACEAVDMACSWFFGTKVTSTNVDENWRWQGKGS